MISGMLLWLTLNVYHESRGESDLQQQHVAHVTINRAKEQNTSVESVVRSKHQFSWTRNKKKLKTKPWVTDPKTFDRCAKNALKAIVSKDTTAGATYFHETRVRPKWAKKKKLTLRNGRFVYYKEKK